MSYDAQKSSCPSERTLSSNTNINRFSFDSKKYDLLEPMKQILSSDESDFRHLHRTKYGGLSDTIQRPRITETTDQATKVEEQNLETLEQIPGFLYKAELLAGFRRKLKRMDKRKQVRIEQQQAKNWLHNPFWEKFLQVYNRFIRSKVVWEEMIEVDQRQSVDGGQSCQLRDEDNHGCSSMSIGDKKISSTKQNRSIVGLLFQEQPVLRIVFPQSVAPPCRSHVDAEYYRGVCPQLLKTCQNFWIPLCGINRKNTLAVEKQPRDDGGEAGDESNGNDGGGDYEIFDDLRYGDGMKFWAMGCRHYPVLETSENDSDDAWTRVSFDFRVIPVYAPASTNIKNTETNTQTNTNESSSSTSTSSSISTTSNPTRGNVGSKDDFDDDFPALRNSRLMPVDMVKIGVAGDMERFSRFFSSYDTDLLEKKRYRLSENAHGIFKFISAEKCKCEETDCGHYNSFYRHNR